MLLPASLSHCHVEAYHDMRRPHSTAVLCGAVGRGLKTPKPCLSSRVISLKKFILQRLHAIKNHQNKKREMLRQFEVLVTRSTDALIASWVNWWQVPVISWAMKVQPGETWYSWASHSALCPDSRIVKEALFTLASTSFMTLRAHIGHIFAAGASVGPRLQPDLLPLFGTVHF